MDLEPLGMRTEGWHSLPGGPLVRIRVLLVALALVPLTACGGSSDGGDDTAAPSPSPTVADTAAATAEITTTWEAFFKGGGAVDSHIALLEDGEKFRPELTAQAKDPSNADLTAKVTDVKISGTTAAVTYDLLGKGAVVLLGGSMGEAVQVGGAWKVSKKTYCQLVTLQDSSVAHPGCTG
jgi:hypothetical protein